MSLVRLALPVIAIAFATCAAHSQEPARSVPIDIPISELNADLLFTCPVEGLPTVGLYYVRNNPNQREISFWQARTPEVAFVLQDAVSSVVKEEKGAETRWIIKAKGAASKAKGISDGAPVSVGLVIRRLPTGNVTLDYEISAGRFSRMETNCPQGPRIDRSMSPKS